MRDIHEACVWIVMAMLYNTSKQASTLVEARAFKGNIVGWGKGMCRNKESVGGFKLPLPLSACALL